MERRLVSVVFADLVGFTALAERLDPEDVAAVQEAYFARAREAIVQHGGRLEKYIGDAVVGAFGVDRTRADDAERAVRAGVAIVAAVAELAPALGLEPGALRVRVGANTGEVLVRRGVGATGEDAWRLAGDAVNVAARLQSAADPGAVLVGPDTAFAAAHAFRFQPAGRRELKGRSAAVPVFEVAEALDAPSREWALAGLYAPTIGRGTELRELEAGVRDPAVPRAYLVVAPPGAGKTRLVTEFGMRLLAAGDRAWQASVTADQGYGAVADLVRAAVGPDLPSPRVAELLRSRLAAGGTDGTRADLGVAHTLALLEGRPLDADAADLHTSWTAVLDALGTSAPPVWIVEDLHLADRDLRAFLWHAVTHPARPDRVLVATARPTVLRAEEPLPAEVRVLLLAPLTEDAATELVHRLLEDDVLPAAVTEGIVGAAAGNPLYVEELVRWWIQEGTLRRRADDRWEYVGDDASARVPATVRAVYLHQLGDLPDAARRVVEVGSIPGITFPEAALPLLGVGQPEDPLVELTGSGVLAGPHRGPLADRCFTYRHALLRETAYATITRTERARLHRRFADWLLARPDAEEVAEAIARHLVASLESDSGLATTADRDRLDATREAAAWLDRAAATAAGSAPLRAAELLERCLELTPADDPLRLPRMLALAEVHRRGGHLEEAMAAFARAGGLAGTAGDAPSLAVAALGYEDALFASRLPRDERGDTSLRLLAEALACGDVQATGLHARLLAARGRALAYGGATTDGEAQCLAAVATARRSGDVGALAYGLLALRAPRSAPSHLGERLVDVEEVVTAARAAAEPEIELEGVRLQLVDLLEAGDLEGADRAQRRAEELVAELGRPLHLWYPPMWQAMRALLAGDGDAAERHIRRFRDEATRWHYRDAHHVHAVQAVELELLRDAPDGALRRLEAVAAEDPIRWAPTYARVHARAGQVEGTREWLQVHAEDGFRHLPRDLSLAYNLALCAEAAAVTADAATAVQLQELLAPWRGHTVVLGSGALCLGAASHFLGLLAGVTDGPDAAGPYLIEALATNERIGAGPAAARTRAALAAAGR